MSGTFGQSRSDVGLYQRNRNLQPPPQSNLLNPNIVYASEPRDPVHSNERILIDWKDLLRYKSARIGFLRPTDSIRHRLPWARKFHW